MRLSALSEDPPPLLLAPSPPPSASEEPPRGVMAAAPRTPVGVAPGAAGAPLPARGVIISFLKSSLVSLWEGGSTGGAIAPPPASPGAKKSSENCESVLKPTPLKGTKFEPHALYGLKCSYGLSCDLKCGEDVHLDLISPSLSLHLFTGKRDTNNLVFEVRITSLLFTTLRCCLCLISLRSPESADPFPSHSAALSPRPAPHFQPKSIRDQKRNRKSTQRKNIHIKVIRSIHAKYELLAY